MTVIKVCNGHSCRQNHSNFTKERAELEAKKRKNIVVENCPCQDNCKNSPTVLIDKKKYNNISPVEMYKLMKNLK